jgi:hypothetical protein
MTTSNIDFVLGQSQLIPGVFCRMAYAQAAYFYALLGRSHDSRRCAQHAESLPDSGDDAQILVRAYLTDAAFFREESQERGDITIEGIQRGSSRQRNWDIFQKRFEGRDRQHLVIDEENSALFGNIKHMPNSDQYEDAIALYRLVEEQDLYAGNNQNIIEMYNEISETENGNLLLPMLPSLFHSIHERCDDKETPYFVDGLVETIKTKSYRGRMQHLYVWLAIAIDAIYQDKPCPDFPDQANFLDRLEALTFLLFAVRGQSFSEESLSLILPEMFRWGRRYRFTYDMYITVMMDNLFTVLALEEQQQSKG